MKEDVEDQPFDLSTMPLGMYAACDVSDQPEWIEQGKDDEPTENSIPPDKVTVIRAMVVAASAAESQANRIAIEKVWRLRLMDMGYHYLIPSKQGGWEIYGQNAGTSGPGGIYGAGQNAGFYATNIIGPHNDIIVGSLIRDVPRVAVFPAKPDDDADITAADAGNQYKQFLAKDNCFEERAAEISRYFCTDSRAAIYMRPVADCQNFGYEDESEDIVPENIDASGDDQEEAHERQTQRTPAIRMVMGVFGVLETKCPMLVSNQRGMSYFQVEEEIDQSTARAQYPWVDPSRIRGGDLGIAERTLARTARCSIKLALKGQYTTGDSMMRDVTNQKTWFRPEFFMDDSCPPGDRAWFFENFPKGMRVDYSGTTFCMARNEGMDEVITNINARTGNGQNRRALTEAYATSNLRLNNWVEIMDKNFRNGTPKLFLHEAVFNVPALRDTSNRIGSIEPFNPQAAGLTEPSQYAYQSPGPVPNPQLAESILFFIGDLAEQQTGAQPSLAGSSETDPETFGAAKLQNGQAMGRLSEPWKAICRGFCSAVGQAIRWAPRVLPESKVLDGILGGKRLTVNIKDMKGNIETEIEGDANFPQSWEQREATFTELFTAAGAGNPFASSMLSDPRNAAQFKQFIPDGMVIQGLDAVEKQEGEFELLLKQRPNPNPQYLQIKQLIQQGTESIQANQQQMIPPDPQELQMLQQASQALQQMPPEVSSVPVLPTDNDAVEMIVALGKINSPEGRRMKMSQDPQQKLAFQNLVLHYNEHSAAAQKKAAAQQTAIPPKTSITMAVDKMDPSSQAKAMQKMAIVTSPEEIEGDGQMQPHEVVQEKEGVDAQGVPVKQKVSLVGKGID